MPSPRMVALQERLTETQSEMDTLEAAAAERGGDFTDNEQSTYDELCNRATQIGEQINTANTARMGMLEAQNTLMQANGGAVVTRSAPSPEEAAEMSAGEYLAEFYKAHHPEVADHTPEEFLNRAARYIDRAQQTTADTAGIIPTPIIGNVIKLSDSRRPAFNSLTPRAMPMKGKTFERPEITQRTTTGTQTEGQALSSQAMAVTSTTVTKATQGGTLDLTQQDIDWTEPEALGLLIQDFVDTYVEWTEGLACDFIEAQPVAADTANNGDGYSPWVTTDIETRVKSVVDGIVDVYNRAKRVADTFWMDLPTWADLSYTMNADKDVTALEMIRRSVADLQSHMGGGQAFRFVVSPQFAADTRIIGASSLGESYEQRKGLLRALQPSTLSVQLAHSGYTAFFGKHQGFVQLGADPTP